MHASICERPSAKTAVGDAYPPLAYSLHTKPTAHSEITASKHSMSMPP